MASVNFSNVHAKDTRHQHQRQVHNNHEREQSRPLCPPLRRIGLLDRGSADYKGDFLVELALERVQACGGGLQHGGP